MLFSNIILRWKISEQSAFFEFQDEKVTFFSLITNSLEWHFTLHFIPSKKFNVSSSTTIVLVWAPWMGMKY